MTPGELFVTELDYAPDITQRLTRINARPGFILLDSCAGSAASGRYDIAVWEPPVVISNNGRLTSITSTDGIQSTEQPCFDVLKSWLPHETAHSGLPFVGGAVGYFSYDLARQLESLPVTAKADLALPPLHIGIYNRALINDHQSRRAWFVSRGLGPQERQAQIKDLDIREAVTPAAFASGFVVESAVQSDIGEARYRQAFDIIKAYIRDGDCYQVNFAQRFSARASGDPWDAYLRLRLLNGAPFAAFLRTEAGAILSSSPERFIQLRNREVETKPIKGTRPRRADARLDQRLAAELKSSEKDQAENLMIVDLLRNDLGKNCKPGSVKVPQLFSIESFARVHHLVSTVRGELNAGAHAVDLLRDAFPGGSITGAPKKRAMEIIEELEPTRRSIYCGAIGYISYDGQMDTNIAIRTLLHENQHLYCWAGGGIVMDSDVAAEYQESLDKAAAMLNLFRDAEAQHLGY